MRKFADAFGIHISKSRLCLCILKICCMFLTAVEIKTVCHKTVFNSVVRHNKQKCFCLLYLCCFISASNFLHCACVASVTVRGSVDDIVFQLGRPI